jgi:hypothetical protein
LQAQAPEFDEDAANEFIDKMMNTMPTMPLIGLARWQHAQLSVQVAALKAEAIEREKYIETTERDFVNTRDRLAEENERLIKSLHLEQLMRKEAEMKLKEAQLVIDELTGKEPK